MLGVRGASLILFPEMSLTSYLREDARHLAFHAVDPRLDRLRSLSAKYAISIIAGAPVAIQDKLFIGAFILDPSGSVRIYTKHHLHSGEEQFFESTPANNPMISLNGEKMAIGICADIENPAHPEAAAAAGCALYLAGIFYAPESMDYAHSLLSHYARQYSMKILMANFSGPCWGQMAGGKSAYWDPEGNLIHSLDSEKAGLLLVEIISR